MFPLRASWAVGTIGKHYQPSNKGLRWPHVRLIPGQLSQRISERASSDGSVVRRRSGLHLVPISTPFPLLDQIAGVGHLVDDPVDAALRDVEIGGNIPKSSLGIIGDVQEYPSVIGKQIPWGHRKKANKY
jgi:hypothetical protein